MNMKGYEGYPAMFYLIFKIGQRVRNKIGKFLKSRGKVAQDKEFPPNISIYLVYGRITKSQRILPGNLEMFPSHRNFHCFILFYSFYRDLLYQNSIVFFKRPLVSKFF